MLAIVRLRSTREMYKRSTRKMHKRAPARGTMLSFSIAHPPPPDSMMKTKFVFLSCRSNFHHSWNPFSEKCCLRRSNNLSSRKTRKKRRLPEGNPPSPQINDKTRRKKKTLIANGIFARFFACDAKNILTKRRVRSSNFIIDLGGGGTLPWSGANLHRTHMRNRTHRELSFIGST
jgi:hypothetical protein